MKEAVRNIKELGRNLNVLRLVRKNEIQMSLEKGAWEDMIEHFTLMRIEQKLWKAHMSKITTKEKEWDKILDVDTEERPIERVIREKVMQISDNRKGFKAILNLYIDDCS